MPPTPPTCDPTISTASDGPALLVRNPEVLERFSLKRVLQQLLDRGGETGMTPIELAHRLFDTQNNAAGGHYDDNMHCDTLGNGAFKNAPAVDCPRAEGALAGSSGLFVKGAKDYFAPIALVNRFDLTPSTLNTCGEYRIVYAKWSGRTDPNDRVFLIFEGALANPFPGDMNGCRPAANLWGSLEKETTVEAIADRLEAFYFTGMPGLAPVIDPSHFGLFSNEDAAYGHTHGQVRVSQRMQDPWEMREFRLVHVDPALPGPSLVFAPITVKNSPMAELFSPASPLPLASEFRSMFLDVDLAGLASGDVTRIRMQTQNLFNAGESAISGPAQANYVEHGMSGDGAPFAAAIEQRLANTGLGDGCPGDDPLTAEAVLKRASVQSCAGCHAPQKVLGADRKIGCGLVWPATLGEAHIDEHGALSPALKDVFLPQRADVLSTYLQACDWTKIQSNFQPTFFGELPK